MVPVVLALYGHPDSAGIWENHLNSRISKEGWKQILPDVRQSIFYHSELNCMLVVYVDDFKLAGPTENKRAVNIGDPEPYDRCQHVEFNELSSQARLIPLPTCLIRSPLLPHRLSIAPMTFGNMTPSRKLGQDIISSPERSCLSLVMRGGEFAKSLHPEVLSSKVSQYSLCIFRMKIQQSLKTT